FTNVPAQFIYSLLPLGAAVVPIAAIAIFCYYIISTLYPIDKIIGRIYPFIGCFLIIITLIVLICLIPYGNMIPDIVLTPEGIAAALTAHPADQPIIPMLFITIACGILSGFHATQSPIVARTMRSERDGRKIFYGMMVGEGLIAMIWAAAVSILFTMQPDMLGVSNGNQILATTTSVLLPAVLASLSLIVFVFLAVTSGDTALRVLRTTIADFLHIVQSSGRMRCLLILPIVAVISALLVWSNIIPTGYAVLWNYFSWFNQLIVSCALLLATAYLACKGKPWILTAVPAAGIVFVCVSYILWVSPAHLAGAPIGFGLPLEISYICAGAAALVLCTAAVISGKRKGHKPMFPPEAPARYESDA
ncbi:MAG: carbon starvation CstA 5TM domain-containing protein, partial [Methanocorpusculum sp.]|nr:carbon starvation CstA 5TM domain-containing protein [Methanocorpusculum sp.]